MAGLYFEELTVGRQFKHAIRRTVSEADNIFFSALTHNPAALLRVERAGEAWRVFVIRALPGIHRPEGLDRTLTLVGVTGGNGVEMSVSREPAALLAALGVLVAMAGVAWSRW